jgi:hypothetical protein
MILICKTKPAMERLQKALVRQEIDYHREKQTIPVNQWVFQTSSEVTLKNWENISKTVYSLYWRTAGIYGDFKDNFEQEKEFKLHMEFFNYEKMIDWIESYDPNKPDYWPEEELWEHGSVEYYYKTKIVSAAQVKGIK